MDLKTYRARTLQEALALVRRDLGPSAAVLRTREVRGGHMLGWLLGPRQIEVTASTAVEVPSRVRAIARDESLDPPARRIDPQHAVAPPNHVVQNRLASQDDLKRQLSDLQAKVEELRRRAGENRRQLPDALFQLYTTLIDADVSEDLARELVDETRSSLRGEGLDDPYLLRAAISRLVEDQFSVAGPINLSAERRRLVALVGPTGVGKTTTIAKLAANFRLRDKKRVGLITVDTYRIAAVEQLRTYADIMDLPMEVVSSPRDMRDAVERMRSLDLVLLDTAGRGPCDDLRIQELRALLGEAMPDEVHLVLSAASSAGTLKKTADRFAGVGAQKVILTKLDEASNLGAILSLARNSKCSLSYVTDGQNVPDDIAAANASELARRILGFE